MLFIIGLELQPSRLWALRRSIFGFGSAQLFQDLAVVPLLAIVPLLGGEASSFSWISAGSLLQPWLLVSSSAGTCCDTC